MFDDLDFWIDKYIEEYKQDKKKTELYPVYIDEDGTVRLDKSPIFKTISERYQKRGYLLKKEFISIGLWKSPRQRSNLNSNHSNKIESTTKKVMESESDRRKVKLLVESPTKLLNNITRFQEKLKWLYGYMIKNQERSNPESII